MVDFCFSRTACLISSADTIDFARASSCVREFILFICSEALRSLLTRSASISSWISTALPAIPAIHSFCVVAFCVPRSFSFSLRPSISDFRVLTLLADSLILLVSQERASFAFEESDVSDSLSWSILTLVPRDLSFVASSVVTFDIGSTPALSHATSMLMKFGIHLSESLAGPFFVGEWNPR